ncbi:MlaC/ttg2D family ABC transporter substrate-binding protein [Pseudaestuariivita atlantica]|uniref:ABC transporter n=1 Tax=Pseudaestuariivita atlantica TaxID=1317121 RepID=A0A0L1JSE0_9RHOB|nr:ABC transporter substrate-binding protein [Pseudaestuariivita atlantica]KNG94704.1 ABC transporter [Pseudaestuariivita atlantica]
MPSNPFRRRRVLGLMAALPFATLPLPALALSEAKAKRLVEGIVADINRIIASGKSEAAMIRDFERIFVEYADVPTIALYTLGRDGRQASNAQKRAFTEAFQGYIARKYGKRFREFIGGRIEVESAKTVKTSVEVRTTAYLRGEAPFTIDWVVSDRSGRDKFFNMVIEGVNMLLTERTEIGAMLDRRRGNIDQLIADLRTAG